MHACGMTWWWVCSKMRNVHWIDGDSASTSDLLHAGVLSARAAIVTSAATNRHQGTLMDDVHAVTVSSIIYKYSTPARAVCVRTCC